MLRPRADGISIYAREVLTAMDGLGLLVGERGGEAGARSDDAAAAALRRRREEGDAEAEAEGWRQTASVEIWVGRWMVEGTEASAAGEGEAGVRRERESV